MIKSYLCFVSGIITEGGLQPNVVPHKASLHYWLRAPDHVELVLLQQRCTACVIAAAKVPRQSQGKACLS